MTLPPAIVALGFVLLGSAGIVSTDWSRPELVLVFPDGTKARRTMPSMTECNKAIDLYWQKFAAHEDSQELPVFVWCEPVEARDL